MDAERTVLAESGTAALECSTGDKPTFVQSTAALDPCQTIGAEVCMAQVEPKLPAAGGGGERLARAASERGRC